MIRTNIDCVLVICQELFQLLYNPFNPCENSMHLLLLSSHSTYGEKETQWNQVTFSRLHSWKVAIWLQTSHFSLFIYICNSADSFSSFLSLPTNTKQEKQKPNKQICCKIFFNTIFPSKNFHRVKSKILRFIGEIIKIIAMHKGKTEKKTKTNPYCLIMHDAERGISETVPSAQVNSFHVSLSGYSCFLENMCVLINKALRTYFIESF